MSNNYPLMKCINQARAIVQRGNAAVFQKFTCSNCGSRQTMTVPNYFYTHGTCEECGKVTDIQKTGCNYMLHRASTAEALAEVKAIHGDFAADITLVDCNNHLPTEEGKQNDE